MQYTFESFTHPVCFSARCPKYFQT